MLANSFVSVVTAPISVISWSGSPGHNPSTPAGRCVDAGIPSRFPQWLCLRWIFPTLHCGVTVMRCISASRSSPLLVCQDTDADTSSPTAMTRQDGVSDLSSLESASQLSSTRFVAQASTIPTPEAAVAASAAAANPTHTTPLQTGAAAAEEPLHSPRTASHVTSSMTASTVLQPVEGFDYRRVLTTSLFGAGFVGPAGHYW